MNKNFSKAEKSLIESDPKLGKVIENNVSDDQLLNVLCKLTEALVKSAQI